MKFASSVKFEVQVQLKSLFATQAMAQASEERAQGVEAVEERRETLRDQIEAFTSHANLGNLEEMQTFPPGFRVDLPSRRGETALHAAVRGRKVIIAAFSLDSAVTCEVIIQLE